MARREATKPFRAGAIGWALREKRSPSGHNAGRTITAGLDGFACARHDDDVARQGLRSHWLALALFGLGALSPAAAEPRADLWIYPAVGETGALAEELVEKPEGWARARALAQGLGFADHGLASAFDDDRLKTLFAFLKRSGLKLQLEVGAVKPWAKSGAEVFEIERKLWDRFLADGAEIDGVTMDEPLAGALNEMKQSEAFAVAETADFVARVRATYPSFRIVDIEPYPAFDAPTLLGFADDLQKALADKGVSGLDGVRLDVDWMHFVLHTRQGKDGWRGVKRLEDALHARKLPVGLIYWAADYGVRKRNEGLTPTTWDDGVTTEARAFLAAGGSPDEFVLETWLPIPAHNVPETDATAFTKSALDLHALVCARPSAACGEGAGR